MRISDFVLMSCAAECQTVLFVHAEKGNIPRNHKIRNPHSEIRNRNLRNLWIGFNLYNPDFRDLVSLTVPAKRVSLGRLW